MELRSISFLLLLFYSLLLQIFCVFSQSETICNLHSCYKFCTLVTSLHSCYRRTALLSQPIRFELFFRVYYYDCKSTSWVEKQTVLKLTVVKMVIYDTIFPVGIATFQWCTSFFHGWQMTRSKVRFVNFCNRVQKVNWLARCARALGKRWPLTYCTGKISDWSWRGKIFWI